MEYKKPEISAEQREKNKAEFIKIFKELIIPAYTGADKLLEWIEKSDFFESPASTMYHSCCLGGLCQHTLNVYKRLTKLVTEEYGDKFEEYLEVDRAGLALIALCHDLCKANSYSLEYRNTKDASGNWIKEPYFKYDSAFEYGHGEKSVYIVQTFISGLYMAEALGIRYHMGASGNPNGQIRDDNALKMMEQFPIILFINMADMEATYLDERREPKE